MMIRNFKINELDLNYNVGINRIKIDFENLMRNKNINKKESLLDYLLELINRIQEEYKDISVQFFDDSLVLNEKHLFSACYYAVKSFKLNFNISKSKNIEILLYLSGKRQIKNSIEAFGLKLNNFEKGSLNYCIISFENNLYEINEKIIKELNAKPIDFSLNHPSVEKIENIIKFFDFSEDQINSILRSYGQKNYIELLENNVFEYIIDTLYDLICEKMALLSLEKLKAD
ncbi:MAG: KEOPS complex subunit Cgi121 [Promethearchaeota archaeon]